MKLEVIVSQPEQGRSGSWSGNVSLSIMGDERQNPSHTGASAVMAPPAQVLAALTACASACGWPSLETMVLRGGSTHWRIGGTIENISDGEQILQTKIIPTLLSHGLGSIVTSLKLCADRTLHTAPPKPKPR